MLGILSPDMDDGSLLSHWRQPPSALWSQAHPFIHSFTQRHSAGLSGTHGTAHARIYTNARTLLTSRLIFTIVTRLAPVRRRLYTLSVARGETTFVLFLVGCRSAARTCSLAAVFLLVDVLCALDSEICLRPLLLHTTGPSLFRVNLSSHGSLRYHGPPPLVLCFFISYNALALWLLVVIIASSPLAGLYSNRTSFLFTHTLAFAHLAYTTPSPHAHRIYADVPSPQSRFVCSNSRISAHHIL